MIIRFLLSLHFLLCCSSTAINSPASSVPDKAIVALWYRRTEHYKHKSSACQWCRSQSGVSWVTVWYPGLGLDKGWTWYWQTGPGLTMETTETTENVNLTRHRRLGSSGSITGDIHSYHTRQAHRQIVLSLQASLTTPTETWWKIWSKGRWRNVWWRTSRVILSPSQTPRYIYLLQLKAELILSNLQSEGLEAPTEGVTVNTTVKRAKSLSEVERKDFLQRPTIVSWIEDTDEWDGKSMSKALKNTPEMHSKLITSS